MNGRINGKLVIFIIIVIAIICSGIFAMRAIDRNRKNYDMEKVSEQDYKYFAVLSNEKYGIINTKGDMVIENNYKSAIIPNPSKPVFIMTKEDGEKDILNENAEKIFTNYKNVSSIIIETNITNLPYEKSVLKFEENGKFGLIDYSGNIIAKAIYDEISSVKYKEGEILAKKDGKYGVINNKGNELIPFEYDEIEADKYYSDGGYSKSGYIVKKINDDGYRYGYINSKWEKMLEAEYTSISRILDIDSDDIYLIVSKNGRFGVMENKKIKVDFAYQGIEYNKNVNLFIVQRNGQYGVIDIDKNAIINIEYKEIKINGIYILAKSYTDEVYFNKKGEKVENSYTAILETRDSDSYITVNKENLYGIVNGKEEEMVKNEYLYIEYAFDNFFIAYKQDAGLGIIDKNGNVAVDFKYDVLSRIGDYRLLKGVDMKENKTDIYSGDMKKIVSMSNAVLEIHEDYVQVYNESSEEYITKKGELKNAKELLEGNKLFAVYKDGKWGFEDREGNLKIDCKYDYVTEFNNYGFAGIKEGNKWGVIDDEGKVVCECKYDFEEQEENVKPSFIGGYYRSLSESNEVYYTDDGRV